MPPLASRPLPRYSARGERSNRSPTTGAGVSTRGAGWICPRGRLADAALAARACQLLGTAPCDDGPGVIRPMLWPATYTDAQFAGDDLVQLLGLIASGELHSGAGSADPSDRGATPIGSRLKHGTLGDGHVAGAR